MSSTKSTLDNEPYKSRIDELVQQGEFNTSIAKILNEEFGLTTTDDSVRRFRKRHGLGIPTKKNPGVQIDGDNATVITPVTLLDQIENGSRLSDLPDPGEPLNNLDKEVPSLLESDAESYPDESSTLIEGKISPDKIADSSVIKDRLNDPDAMLRERGLDPNDWTVEGITVNEWDGPTAEGTTVTYKQAKLQLKRKKPEQTLLPARSSGWTPKIRTWGPDPDQDHKTVVLVGDQQAPFHDERLHSLFLEWLNVNLPDEGVLIGDTVDFPDVSRHRANPENYVSANECIQAGYEILRDYVAESHHTQWTKLIGNHDERIRNFVIDNAKPLHGLTRATRSAVEKEEKVLDIEYLLRLDELGIKLVDPKGGYAQAQVNIDDALAVRHGWLTRRGGGATALASLESVGYNIVVGHTHRQSLVQKTTHSMSGEPTTLYGVEAGCMCSIDGIEVNGRRFPDYTTNPDWQQGFAVATVYGDGTTNIELATYRNGSLFYRDQRYS